MPKPTILNPKERYSFSQYFDMNYAAEDILADLGCHLIRTRIHSPKAPPAKSPAATNSSSNTSNATSNSSTPSPKSPAAKS
jgi:hypothetical protein